jgi:hypothetical protein
MKFQILSWFPLSAFPTSHRSLLLLSILSISSFASDTPPGIAAPFIPVVTVSARPVTASKQATAAKAARPPVPLCSRRRAGLSEGTLEINVAAAFSAALKNATINVAATDKRMRALSQIESGDNDLAIGASGEISRYQISPSVWQKYFFKSVVSSQWLVATHYYLLSTNYSNSVIARAIASAIMADRCGAFERKFNHSCTDCEFYILWSRPACLLASNSHLPSASVRSRAQRFANLCNSLNQG